MMIVHANVNRYIEERRRGILVFWVAVALFNKLHALTTSVGIIHAIVFDIVFSFWHVRRAGCSRFLAEKRRISLLAKN